MDAMPFFEAIESRNEAAVRSMVAAEPGLVGGRDRQGATGLHHAVAEGRRGLACFLIEQGADVNARDGQWGATPAGWAIEYLRERGALLAIEIDDFLHAVERGDTHWAERWLRRFPGLASCADAAGRTALDCAREAGSAGMVRVLEDARNPEG
jgi:ankyrin repeat protein